MQQMQTTRERYFFLHFLNKSHRVCLLSHLFLANVAVQVLQKAHSYVVLSSIVILESTSRGCL